jgi:hypothetical protein
LFTHTDLTRLIAVESGTTVSIFMPTHLTGKDVRQDPIRLKNLLAEARSQLATAGHAETEVDAILEPAARLVNDRDFWQHQSDGLALFLTDEGASEYRVPLVLEDRVVVGHRPYLRPLLPLLSADGHFAILTMTADDVAYYNASRFELARDDSAELPERESVENDYENPVQASPPARPNVGTANISNAQVYGDGPPDFRKARLLEFVADVARSTERILAATPQPLVLVADTEIGGHFQQVSDLGRRLAGIVEVNPASLPTSELHELAYGQVREQLDSGRTDAVAAAAELVGRGDREVAIEVADIVRAANRGQIGSLLLVDGDPIWGRYDPDADRLETGPVFEATGEDLLSTAVVETLLHGGSVHVVAQGELPGDTDAVALLRY